ncbi:hypothetical protein F511_02822 [Dorcoceras hygrometricum]|uniref:S-protein homolog n=1 Tax=Dorcoceras hygrometricum TaxID=472368 RepID=A0A2Z7BL04_9LAMI|nr:hypothetical protein F511_02822 [Dorcoceras hygrometricum]
MSKIPIFLIAIAMNTMFTSCSADGQWTFGMTYHVHIINGFKNNSNPLKVHCRSKDDDLGEHKLGINGEISWHFKVRLDGSTLFYCDAKKGQHSKHFNAFDATVEGSKCDISSHCYWLLAEGGFYFSTDNFTWMKQFEW